MSQARALTDQEMIVIGKALADPRRLRMLHEIVRAGTLCCQDMRAAHPVSAATISHHMKELGAAGLVENVRAGKFARLRFRHEKMRRYLHRLHALFASPSADAPRECEDSQTIV